ncbi:MAG: hypothetical protein AAF771_07050 [Pseudomonadota bacterium]
MSEQDILIHMGVFALILAAICTLFLTTGLPGVLVGAFIFDRIVRRYEVARSMSTVPAEMRHGR